MALPAKPASRSLPPAPLGAPSEDSSRPSDAGGLLSSHSVEGDALLDEVRHAVSTLESLLVHADHLGESVASNVRSTLAEVRQKLDRKELSVVVVAEKGAGKTTFLNAVLGEGVLSSKAGEPQSVMYLRRGDAAGYVAHIAGGAVIDFEKRYPDTTRELIERSETYERELSGASSEREHAALELIRQRAVADQAQGELKNKFQAFESARAEAERLATEVVEAAREQNRLKEQAAACEKKLPKVVRTFPPLWAVWLLIAYGLLLIFHLKTWRAWRAMLGELESAKTRTSRLKLSVSEAALLCRQAEAALDPLASPAESAQAGWASAQKGLRDIDSELERVESESNELRAQLEATQAERRRRFLQEVRELCDVDVRGKDLLELTISYPSVLLPEDVTIIDAPGVTAQSTLAQERAWEVIREQADGCILLSELERAVTGPTRTFLQRVRDVVPHVLLVLTKMDASFIDAVRRGASEPWEHVEQARRIATRRFAREIGRDAGSVLSIAVAAEAALEESETTGLGRRFEAEVNKLFQLLRFERALIVGSRAAIAVRRCIESAAEAQKRAERFHEDRIFHLEEQRRPQPESFRTEQISASQKAILEAAAEVTGSALEALVSGMNAVRARATEQIMACKSKDRLVALAPPLEQQIQEGVSSVALDVARHVDLQADAAVRRIELGVFEALRLRYEISSLVTRSSNPSFHLDDVAARAGQAPEILAGVTRAVRSFDTFRIGLGAGGTTAGALVGTLVLPGIGTAVGAALGVFAAFARTLGSLKRECSRAVEASLTEPEQRMSEQVRGAEASVARGIGLALEDSVARAMGRFDPWIAEPLEAERKAIETERELLEDLQALREQLHQHDAQLGALTEVATAASLGLCR